MVSLEFSDSELDFIWTRLIEFSCEEFTRMQSSKTASDLLKHKQIKYDCDNIIKRLKEYRN